MLLVPALQVLNVDGGISTNQFVVQLLADLLETEVRNIGISDVSALGAAYLAGLETEVFQSLEQIATLSSHTRTYTPGNSDAISFARKSYEGWQEAIQKH